MTNGTQIRAIEDAQEAPGTEASAPAEALSFDEGYAEAHDYAREPRGGRALPLALAAAAILAVAGWTGFYVWTHRAAMMAGAPAELWLDWLSQWSVPVLLLAVVWLIAMRSSAREASRFGDAAQALTRESAALETRLVTVNRELSLAREFLAAQSRDLEYLGRASSERIAENAAKLQALIVDNGAQVEAIATVSHTALANMTELRDNLPVVANSARDVTNQIGGAGRTAKAQVGELIAGFERLNEFGQASERQVASLRERIDNLLHEMARFAEETDAANAARIAAMQRDGETWRAEQEAREEAALEALRTRADALQAELAEAHEAREREEATAVAAMRGRVAIFSGEAREAAAAVRAAERAAMEAWEGQTAELRDRLAEAVADIAALDQQALDKAREKLAALTAEAEGVDERVAERDRDFRERIAQRQADFAEAEEGAFARLTERADALDQALMAQRDAQLSHIHTLGTQGEALAARTGEIAQQLATIVERSTAAETTLAASAGHFANAVADSEGQLRDTEARLAQLTDASVRLLELIQAAAAHSRDDLPGAIEGFETRLAALVESGDALRSALTEAQHLGSGLDTDMAGIRRAGEEALGDLDTYRQRLSETAQDQTNALREVRGLIAQVAQDNRDLTQGLSSDLTAAVERFKTASAGLIENYEGANGDRINSLAERIGDESAAAIDKALEVRTAEAVAKLDAATLRSVEASREALAGLRDQLARVHELAGNLEARASRAREQVEEQVDNDFSRRMALITESLNSHSIDIAKALSTEVTDIAWASYLKGDRGVFTRRAVRLIDGSEAREIAALFESDHEFRDHVSRYIHDFEAMLRTMLSTRDGHALGVTVLSSDMGKLYVALAHAIQRLRQ